jgi:titin
MPLKILDFSGNGSGADLVEAIYYAVDNGADVINMSLGFPGSGEPDANGAVCGEVLGLADALNYAADHEVVVVAAAGNDGGDLVSCPAAYPTVIAVGATRIDGQVTFYSNRGAALDIAAPGGDPNVDQDGDGFNDGVLQETYCLDAFTMLITGDYGQFCEMYLSGTSMASPHVAGTAALLLGADPGLSALQVRYLIETTAHDRGAAGWDSEYGHGALDGAAAVASLLAGPPPEITPTPFPTPTPIVAPNAPSELVATALSSTSVRLNWVDNASNESGFRVERATGSGAFSLVATLGANTTTWTNGGLTPATTYRYRVRAYDAATESANSNEATATTAAPPAAPTSLSATALSSSSVRLNWVDNATTETFQWIERSTDGSTFTSVGVVAANVVSYTAQGLTPGTQYWFRVRAYDGSTYSGYSNVATATTFPPPAAPTNLAVVVVTATSVQLTWTDNATTESGYRVERSTDGGATFTQVGVLGANAVTYTSTGLTPGTTYHFRVRAADGLIYSPYSAVVAATTAPGPAAPTNLQATALSSASIRLTWTDNTASETFFWIERSTDGVSFVSSGVVGTNVTSYTVQLLLPGTQYWFRVRAQEGSLYSPYSAVATATTVGGPSAPTGLAASAASNSSIQLAWTDNATTETSYRVERSTDGVSFLPVATLGANMTSYLNQGLAAGTTYYFRVRAHDGTTYSAYSNTASAATLPPPAAPSNAVATALGATSIRVTWTDNSASETWFRVERSADGVGGWLSLATLAANTTTYTNANLSPSTTYHYRVVAVEGSAVSAASNVASATTFAPPAAPTNLAATPLTSTSIRLTWSDNATTENGFRVERSLDGTTWSQVGLVGANATTWTNVGLASGTTYFYRVRAYEGLVNGPYSGVASATTP